MLRFCRLRVRIDLEASLLHTTTHLGAFLGRHSSKKGICELGISISIMDVTLGFPACLSEGFFPLFDPYEGTVSLTGSSPCV